MPDSRAPAGSRRILVLAPSAKDARVAERILQDAGLEPSICRSVAELCVEANAEAGAAIVAEEHLLADGIDAAIRMLDEQPPWSDLPIVLLMRRDDQIAPPIARFIEAGNVTLVTRPLRVAAFLSVVQSCIRDRVRQYSVRDFLVERENAAKNLQAALEGASAANVAKSQFLANMSHEIRTPMTAVLGYAELLAEGETEPERREFLEIVKRNGQFLLEIVNDILDLSKIEVGKLEIQREAVSPVELAVDVRTLMQVRAQEKGLSLDVEIDGKVPASFESDPTRLRQILVNLVGNAIKFTERGGVRIVVGLACDADETLLRFQVVDTGIGMSPDQRKRLFQPFTQGDASVTRSFGGTGLGLAISQRLAELLGGRISATSEPGTGSAFSFDLPINRRDVEWIAPPSLDRAVASKTNSANATRRLSCRVLVVDDRRDVRMLTQHILKRAGAEVEFAIDGVEALETVGDSLGAERPFDVILLDMQMPRLDGYETATRLRRMGYASPIIALTADAMHGDMRRCLEIGCNAYLSKPIDAGELVAAVATLTSR